MFPRESDVLAGLMNEYPNKTIAYGLGISPRTVEIYRANVMTMMKAASLSELVPLVLGEGQFDRDRELLSSYDHMTVPSFRLRIGWSTSGSGCEPRHAWRCWQGVECGMLCPAHFGFVQVRTCRWGWVSRRWASTGRNRCT